MVHFFLKALLLFAIHPSHIYSNSIVLLEKVAFSLPPPKSRPHHDSNHSHPVTEDGSSPPSYPDTSRPEVLRLLFLLLLLGFFILLLCLFRRFCEPSAAASMSVETRVAASDPLVPEDMPPPSYDEVVGAVEETEAEQGETLSLVRASRFNAEDD